MSPIRAAVPVFIDPDDLHPLEAVLLVDQHPLALGQNGVVGGVPGHPEPLGDPSHGQVLDHDPFQRPPQSAPRQLGPGLGRGGGVLAPHIPAAAAAVTAHDDLQRRGPPAQWFVGKPSDHGVTWSPFAAAAPAPLVGLDHLAGQYGTIRLESLPGDNEAEFVEAAEGSQVGAGERISAPADGSVVHVEVFRAECVGALILGRPRPLSGHRRAGPPRDVRYTLIWEEPVVQRAGEVGLVGGGVAGVGVVQHPAYVDGLLGGGQRLAPAAQLRQDGTGSGVSQSVTTIP